MASRLLRASYRMVKLMTEIELNEKITNLLSENPTQQKTVCPREPSEEG